MYIIRKKNCESGIHIERALFRSVSVVLNLVFIDYFKLLSPKLRVTSSTNRYIYIDEYWPKFIDTFGIPSGK